MFTTTAIRAASYIAVVAAFSAHVVVWRDLPLLFWREAF